MASTKVADILKELGITYDELKKTTDRMGIEVTSNRGSISEFDANRVIDTITKLKGLNVNKTTEPARPRIKAVPVLNRGAGPKPRPPIGKPVVPKDFDARPKKEPKEPAPATPGTGEETVAAPAAPAKAKPTPSRVPRVPGKVPGAKEPVKAAPEPEKPEVKEPVKVSVEPEVPPVVAKPAEPAPEKPAVDKAPEKPAVEKVEKPAEKPVEKAADQAEKPADKPEEKAEKPAKPAEKTEKPAEKVEKPAEKAAEPEPYQNAPGKPMRFKKIFDATTQPEPEKKPKREPRSKDGRGEGKGEGKAEGKPEGKGGRVGKGDRKPQQKRGEGQDDQKPARPQQGKRPAGGGATAPAESAPAKAGKGKGKKYFENKDKDKDRDRDSKRRFEKKETGGAKNTHYFDEHSLEKQTRHKRKSKARSNEADFDFEEMLPEGTIAVTAPITVAGLAEQAEISVSKIIMSMMQMGVMATINQSLDKDTIEMLAEDLGLNVVVTEEEPEIEEEGIDLHEDSENDLQPRPPIITVMGHVDHGKTSLLDAIRNTNVTAGESGGITQHIGASEVEINGKKIVFLDTPGHEAFTTMRARGAQVTDIAVLVVAADDGVMPQTVESISHAKAAGVPIIVAINKMDKPGANPERVKQELTEHGILVEEWGGNVISVPVSAKKGEGITDLLEMILLQAEVLELKANPDRLAMGTVIEARLDKAKGPIATLLVTNGTLKTGQSVVAGTSAGKIRVMTDFKGKPIRKAGPATAVEILGLSDVPEAGDAFNVVRDDKTAREIAANRKEKMREDVLARNASMTLDKLFSQIQQGETKELNLIVKADVQGSVGAIVTSLEKLEAENVKVRVVHSGVGTVNESDVMLAETSNAIIIGFNVRPTTAVMNQAADANVEIRLYRVIYDIIDDIQDALKGMLDPEYKEEVLGKAEVRDTFKVPSVGTIAGAYVTEGKIQRNMQIRLVRDGIVIHEGVISSLRRFKDDVKEVNTGYECGIGIEKYNDIKQGDEIECFTMVEIKR